MQYVIATDVLNYWVDTVEPQILEGASNHVLVLDSANDHTL